MNQVLRSAQYEFGKEKLARVHKSLLSGSEELGGAKYSGHLASLMHSAQTAERLGVTA